MATKQLLAQIAAPRPALSRAGNALVGQPHPDDSRLTVTRILYTQILPNFAGGTDEEDVHLLLLVEAEEKRKENAR